MVEDTRLLHTAANIILLIGMAFILLPLVITAIVATQSYEDFIAQGLSLRIGDHFWQNIKTVFTETTIPRQITNSVIVALLVACGKCVLAFLTAFAIVYFQARYGTLIFAFVLATILMPIDLRVITTYQIAANIMSPINGLMDLSGLNDLIERLGGQRLYFELSLLNSYIGMAAPVVAHGTGTFLFRQYLRTLPKDLARAATLDGAGPIRFMIDIALPLSKAPMAALFVLMFLGGWTQYLWPLVAASTPDMQTAVVGLARLAPNLEEGIPDYPMIMTAALLVSIIPLGVTAFMQRFITYGLTLVEK
ncbi:MAG: ABC transporter permease subunit [Pseudomonadota bacterium]